MKILTFITWVALVVGIGFWAWTNGINPSEFATMLREFLLGLGMWGPIVLLAIYLVHAFVFFLPLTVLAYVAGTVYGPFGALALIVAGENMCAWIGFMLGRVYGRRFIERSHSDRIHRLEHRFRDRAFETVLFLRLALFSFTVTNMSSGASGMKFRTFALASVIGLFPINVTTSLLGPTIHNAGQRPIFFFVAAISLTTAFIVRRYLHARH